MIFEPSAKDIKKVKTSSKLSPAIPSFARVRWDPRWEFVMMKKCTLASQEFLEISDRARYHPPECPKEFV